MSTQYWIGGFFIDLSRNQITQNNQAQTIAPKALAVLTYLAENQGKVVSQDALLDKVWQDTAVSPNTLQKSIAQLRKALGDSGNVYIKTHAKQGYSLECDVRWHDMTASRAPDSPKESVDVSADSSVDKDITDKPKPSVAVSRPIAILAGLLSLGLLLVLVNGGYEDLAPEQNAKLNFDKLRSLTATDDKEFDATYTPDGQYIVFHRYLDKQCVNKIWAKNISTQQEIQLTQDWAAYGRHSFSKDGKQLVFLATAPCNEPDNQKNCYDLMSLDFEKALESPQQPSVILQCKNTDVMKPTWLNNGDIALMQRHSNSWKLINYSFDNHASTDLYLPDEGNLIDYAYSVVDDLIAVARIHTDNKQYIELLKPDGRILSSHPIERQQEIPEFRPIYPNFDALNKQLVFSTGRQLFTLSYEGKVDKINLPFIDKMAQPEFHPNGKRLLMLKGPYDSDIVKLPLNKLTETDSVLQSDLPQLKPSRLNLSLSTQSQFNQAQTYTSFERTNLGEDFAKFQPGGQMIAFWSERSGEPQVWISDGDSPLKLTSFPTDTNINGFDWAADGQSLLVNANYELTKVYLDSSQKPVTLQYPVVRLYQWDSQNNSAILALRIKGITKVVEYDFNLSEIRDIREINENSIIWALKSDDGRIIFKDYMGQFWQPGPVEPQQITALDKQAGKAKSFVMNENVIYAINPKNQLWSYDLDNDDFKILGTVDEAVDYLTDVNQTELLMTIQVAAKKEVVELSISE